MSKKGLQNVRRSYVQSALSGFNVDVQQRKEDSDSRENKPTKKEVNPFFWQQKKYVLYVPVIIEQVDVSGNDYKYKISVPTNLNLSLSTYKPQGKNLSGQAFSLDAETKQDKSGIYLVYGIPKEGSDTLSPASINPIRDAVPYLFSRILGHTHRAIERIIYFSGKGKKLQAGTDDTGECETVTPTRENLGGYKTTRRGDKVRREIRSKGQAEGSPVVDEKNGSLLGERQEDGNGRLVGVGEDPFTGTGLEGGVVEF